LYCPLHAPFHQNLNTWRETISSVNTEHKRRRRRSKGELAIAHVRRGWRPGVRGARAHEANRPCLWLRTATDRSHCHVCPRTPLRYKPEAPFCLLLCGAQAIHPSASETQTPAGAPLHGTRVWYDGGWGGWARVPCQRICLIDALCCIAACWPTPRSSCARPAPIEPLSRMLSPHCRLRRLFHAAALSAHLTRLLRRA
jgi:hypothetical protein